MSIEETVYKLKQECMEDSYGCKKELKTPYDIEDYIIQSDLILERKDGKPINIDDYVILSNEDYKTRIESAKLTGKLELLNKIFEDNPQHTCISGCNINI